MHNPEHYQHWPESKTGALPTLFCKQITQSGNSVVMQRLSCPVAEQSTKTSEHWNTQHSNNSGNVAQCNNPGAFARILHLTFVNGASDVRIACGQFPVRTGCIVPAWMLSGDSPCFHGNQGSQRTKITMQNQNNPGKWGSLGIPHPVLIMFLCDILCFS
jgi:hypothetical protein